MAEDRDVTGIGDVWGKASYRKLSIARCENGYVVKYVVAKPIEDVEDRMFRTSEKQKVFITNTDLLEFVEKYFEGEPKP